MAARELVVLGTASQAPTRTRNHNGYFLRWDAAGLLFDPGEGTQRQMLLAGVTASSIGWVCITHFHGDHCLGLPGVLQRMALDQVTHPVQVCYPAENGEYFGRLRHASLSRDSLCLAEHLLSPPGSEVAAGDAFTLEARALSHRVPAFGYRLVEPDGRRMRPDLLVAHGISGPDISRVQKNGKIIRNGKVVSLSEVSEPRRGQKFALIMDTRLCDAAFELADRVDMLVCESTFTDADAGLAEDYGHLTAGQAGRIAAESGARLLVLTHFSQRYGSGSAEMSQFAREAAAVFDGEIMVANDLDRIPVPSRRRDHAERLAGACKPATCPTCSVHRGAGWPGHPERAGPPAPGRDLRGGSSPGRVTPTASRPAAPPRPALRYCPQPIQASRIEETGMAKRNGSAEWRGGLQTGSGTVRVGDGVFEGEYSANSRFGEEDSPQTNPEQLIAAAHAACFSMALSNILASAGHTPGSVQTEARVTLRFVDNAPTITAINLATVGTVPGLNAAEFQKFAEDAKAACPVSRALAAVPEISVVATLA